uniref:C2H2-type domain-containing protein n=1 Tax=Moniliophthora roreri TaxID=221103 RepID=A0A0W0FR28_MONRR
MSIHIPLQVLAHFQLVLEIPSANNSGKEVTFTLKPLPLEHTANDDHSNSLPSLHFKSRETEGGVVLEVTRSGSCNIPASYSPEPYFSHADSNLHRETDISHFRIGERDGGQGHMSEVVQAGLPLPQDTSATQAYGLTGDRHIENMDFILDALPTSKTIALSGPFPESRACHTPWSGPSVALPTSDQPEGPSSTKETVSGSEPLSQSKASTPWSSLSGALSTTNQTESILSTSETTIPDSDIHGKRVSQPAERTTRRPRLFPCKVPGCNRSFTSEYTRETHTLSHRPKHKRRYPCTMCDALFSRNHDRYRHEVSQHGKRTEWECECCMQCFSSENSLIRHDCSQAEK